MTPQTQAMAYPCSTTRLELEAAMVALQASWIVAYDTVTASWREGN